MDKTEENIVFQPAGRKEMLTGGDNTHDNCKGTWTEEKSFKNGHQELTEMLSQ